MKLFIEQECYKIKITNPFSDLKTTTFLTLIITVTDAAKGLCVSRKTLSALLNGPFGISPEMAIRLSKGFGTIKYFINEFSILRLVSMSLINVVP
jgi:addiction module HigA family antidote